VIKSSKMWWHRLLFRDKGILPTPRLIWAAVLLVIPVLSASLIGLGWQTVIVLNGILLLVSLADLVVLPRRRQIQGQRILPDKVERGHHFTVRIVLRNASGTSIQFRLVDDLPVSFLRPFPIHGDCPGLGSTEVSYDSMATVRGNYELQQIYFRYRSGLGLWEKQMAIVAVEQVKVIPDLTQVRGFMASAQQMLMLQGVKIRRHRIGSGEFSQVRNYSTDDDPRKINWHASARHGQLMTNVYEPEHGKQITIMIDSGRTMGVELTEGTRLEQSLEAALTVAAIALGQGDHVSVLAFSNEIKSYIPPGQGISHLQTIVEGIYDLQSDPVESNYAKAFHHLETYQKRRSFIMLFSDLDHYLLEDALLPYVMQLRRRHLFLLMGIEDPMTYYWIQKEPTETKVAMTKSMAQQQWLVRKQDIRKWERLGLQVVEAREEHLVTESVQHYIDMINRGLL
jgi:uncharacterized protein (DUF58 family)